jgi:mono/diheme cytochrome c family protein
VPRPTRRDRPARSLADGVFTTSQAAQGKQLFAQECSLCHQSANYTGANFAAKWGEGTLGDVYQDMALGMPPANAGGLTPATYASIVAYFVSESGYPSGNAELPGDAAQLRGIAIGAPVDATP